MECKDKLLTDCCKTWCNAYSGEAHDFAKFECCHTCPILKLFKEYKCYYNEVVWGNSNPIGNKQEMGCW